MDLALNSSRSPTGTQHRPYDAAHLNNEPAAQIRNVRYTSPDMSTTRRINESNAVRSPPNGETTLATMSRTSPAISPFVISQVLQEPDGSNTDTLPEVNGQNHDRMETDMESEDSRSENQSAGRVEELVHPPATGSATQLEDGEIMDTAPDSPAALDAHASLEVGQATGTSSASTIAPLTQPESMARPSSNESTTGAIDDGAAGSIAPTPDVDASLALFPPPFAPLGFEDLVPTGTPAVENASQPASGDVSAEAPADPQPPAATDPAAPVWDAPEPRGDWGGEREEESQDDDSTDDEDYPFWANIKEDTSGPDEEELRAIEETIDEVSALDHEHWEKLTYEALDDPEYIPGPSGRITWTVQGVNGTPEKPNKERIMRSPSVLIGDHYWNIKYYPRGNDGTEQLSVYIECATSPYEEKKGVEATSTSPVAKSTDRDESLASPVETGNPPGNEAATANDPPVATQGGGHPDSVWADLENPPFSVVEEPVATSAEPLAANRWEVAAQVSCVVHNPAEPRVHVCQKSSHRYYNDNPDWGWTRFHGPWEEIHKRQRFQRQALLRNDTLVFTAYIRTIKDDTGALWWHPPKEKPEWNSVARVGLKRLICGHFQSSALIAAISSWLYLVPIVDVIFLRFLDGRGKPGNRIPPLLDALQQLARDALGPVSSDLPEVSLASIANILEWYGENIYYSKMDVVATWETLRRILNLEAAEVASVAGVADTGDIFQNVLTLKQSDIRKFEHPFSADLGFQESDVKPRSVCETVQSVINTVSDSSTEGQNLSTFQKALSEYPATLQIELHRQKYSSRARRWMKLCHQIQIDETLAIDLPFSGRTLEYTLYGMIIHSGDLESNDYYSVVRPGGPGSPWVKYAGDRDRKGVIRLTSKQAITNHEGIGEYSEGTAAMAYVVLYVRTDSLHETLSREWKPPVHPSPDLDKEDSSMAEEISGLRTELQGEKRVSVLVYHSDIFKATTGRGILDPVLQRSPNLNFEFAASATLFQLEKYLVEQYANADKPKWFRLWVLEADTPGNVRGLPRLISPSGDISLDEVARTYGGCHFWLHVIPTDEIGEIRQYGASAEEQPAAPSPGQSAAVEEPASSDQNRPGEVMQEQGGPSSQNAAIPTVAHEDDSGSARPAGTANDEDTIMDEAQDVANSEEPVPAAPTEPSLSWVVGTERAPKLHDERIYFFLKRFDCQNQTLCGVGGFFAKQEEKIGEVTRRLLSWGTDDMMDVYCEKSLLIKEKHRVKTNHTFRSMESAFFTDGSILIAQRRPSESDVAYRIAQLEAEGKCTNPIDFFTWLHHQSDPSYLQSRRLQSYFGGPYISTAQKYGRPHGDGIQITMPGDAYSGNFVAGTMSGHGTMAFANGDMYTGQWKHNEPNGQGKMVYAKTGNVYIGGFRKRKRHGKGTMQFEVADEEMQLCRICYEEEMDALFYDCGHVAACEGCAKQVEICPVCRKSVKAVVKIWRT
ncbi:hypothetical protein MMC07_008631 [Pseudocyphellaria aurata]|nr:hypothetical protein [Pseudocyphellaria aurata]